MQFSIKIFYFRCVFLSLDSNTMHGIDLKTQMDIVYHSLNDTSKGIIDASCCGAFKRKSAEEARDLIANLANAT